MSIQFKVSGPFEIPLNNNRQIDTAQVREFWGNQRCQTITAREFSQRRGCYIFALRSTRGHMPWYVGKTRRNFYSESFADHKLRKYNAVLLEARRGTPVMFFVTRSDTRERIPESILSELEIYLIKSATIRNPNNKNIRHTNIPCWSINGVLRARPGTNSQVGDKFKNMMGI